MTPPMMTGALQEGVGATNPWIRGRTTLIDIKLKAGVATATMGSSMRLQPSCLRMRLGCGNIRLKFQCGRDFVLTDPRSGLCWTYVSSKGRAVRCATRTWWSLTPWGPQTRGQRRRRTEQQQRPRSGISMIDTAPRPSGYCCLFR